MAKVITLRNIGQPNVGNPSSALATAVSAFGSAGAGAQRGVENARAKAALERQQEKELYTNRALAAIGKDGQFDAAELGGIDARADYAAVLQQFNDRQALESDIASAAASNALRGAQTIDLENRNTPEYLKAQAEEQAARTAIAQQNADTATAMNARQQQQLDAAAAKTAVLGAARNQWHGEYRDAALATVESKREDHIKNMMATRRMSRGEAEASFDELRPELLENEMRSGAKNFISDFMANNEAARGLAPEDWMSTVAGEYRKDFTDSVQKVNEEYALQAKTQRQNRYKAAQTARKGKNMSSLTSADGITWEPMLDPTGAGDNHITAADSLDYINRTFKADIDGDELSQAKTVLGMVGGNAEAFEQVMGTDGVLSSGVFGSDLDKVDWDKAEEAAFRIGKAMKGAAAGFEEVEKLDAELPITTGAIDQQTVTNAANAEFVAANAQNNPEAPEAGMSMSTQEIAEVFEAGANATPKQVELAETDFIKLRDGLNEQVENLDPKYKTDPETKDAYKRMQETLATANTGKASRKISGGRNLEMGSVVKYNVDPAGQAAAAARTQELLQKILAAGAEDEAAAKADAFRAEQISRLTQ